MNLENSFVQPQKPKMEESNENNENEIESGNEKEKNKKLKIDFYGKEYELEFKSYNFEYPEKIQKETGVLGYKRHIISDDEILKTIKERLEDFGMDVKDCGDYDSINKVLIEANDKKKKELGFVYGLRVFEQSEEVKKYYNTEEGMAINQKVRPEMLFSEFDQFFSNKEFPFRTINHVMGSYYSREKNKEMEESFIKNKFFIQNIFDLNLAKEIKLGKRATSVDSTEDIIFDVYEKKSSGMKIDEVSSHDLSKYEDKVKNNEVYLIGNDALNTTAANFWEENQSIGFGFTMNDELFSNYIKKTYEIFLKNNFNTGREIVGIEQVVRMLAFFDNGFYKDYQSYFEGCIDLEDERNKARERSAEKLEAEKGYYRREEIDISNDHEFILKEAELKEMELEINKKFVKIINDFLPNVNLEESILAKKTQYTGDGWTLKSYNNNELFLNKIKNILNKDNFDYTGSDSIYENGNKTFNFLKYSARRLVNYGTKAEEICIPIFINHDEIPQICWGYAKYGHFYNKKGFNFIEFNHAKELPKPINAKSE